MTQLSRCLTQIKPRYQAIVVGSGYGGGVAASRLSRMGLNVCILERGKEYHPGEFPNTIPEAAKSFQVKMAGKQIGCTTSLYDFHVNEDMNIFVGCGLGGTSLVNANVSLQAEPRVFNDSCWPNSIRAEANQLNNNPADDSYLARGYQRARSMLKPQTYPASNPALKKMHAHQQSAQGLGEPIQLTPINVTFNDGTNHVGVEQKACNNCGDCVSGCNNQAKNTTAMNYLPDAVNHGADIFTCVNVSHISKIDSGWRVFYQPQNLHRDVFDAPLMFVDADQLVLAAGTLGSTEILLRSKEKGLVVSDQLGQRFSGNGDVLAFGYNCDQEINGIGFGDNDPEGREPVGPCITSVIEARNKPDLSDGMVIEEGSLPGAMAGVLPYAFSAAAAVTGVDTDEGLLDALQEKARELDSKVRGGYHGAVRNTQTYLVMSHDDSDGEMALEKDQLRVNWPGVGNRPVFQKISDTLLEATRPLGGTYVPNPMWNKLLGHDLVTVHPLGGCGMADSADQGVVNDRCQVFSGNSGTDVYDGLYVCDGSIMPRSLGVNPLLTITALSERAMMLLADKQAMAQNYSETSAPGEHNPQTASQLGIQFTETMRGKLQLDPGTDFATGGKEGQPFEFTLSVISDDLNTLLDQEGHKARITGTVKAPGLSEQALTITHGQFQLFVRDPEVIRQRRMVYRMQLNSESGETFFFHGYKLAHDDKGFDVWSDTTTLYISVYKGTDEQGELLGRGMLYIEPEDFARQMTTMEVRNADNIAEKAQALLRFGRFFAGSLMETYGGMLARDKEIKIDQQRERRPLKVCEPEVFDLKTEDQVQIRLSRYSGGEKGPVLVVHGLGVSSQIYSLDTVEQNLLEALYADGFDVWLMELRTSILLETADEKCSADEIARYDYPAAVQHVLKTTGANDLQVVAHCVGSTTFTMAMLGGLEGVRSAVLSQVSTHYRSPLVSDLKAGLYLPNMLDKLGISSLKAFRKDNTNWLERLYDKALKLDPVQCDQQSNNPVVRRVNFIYGQLWEMDQLNTATYDILQELFGTVNIETMEQMSQLVRTGHVVNKDGGEVYLPQAQRMAIPIRFISGSKNKTFLPESTELSRQYLSEVNHSELYDRIVIDGYGHIDCIFGHNAHKDVYPHVLEHLNRHA